MGIWGQGGSTQFQGYDYVQTAQPADPKEGQTWYDLDADSARVFDGAAWVEMTVTDHGQLSGVVSDAHHARYSDSEAKVVADTEIASHVDVSDAHHSKTASAAELSDVSADIVVDAHHARYTDSEAIQATDGIIDAETVDSQHADDLMPPGAVVEWPKLEPAPAGWTAYGSESTTTLDTQIDQNNGVSNASNMLDGDSGTIAGFDAGESVLLSAVNGQDFNSVNLSGLGPDDRYEIRKNGQTLVDVSTAGSQRLGGYYSQIELYKTDTYGSVEEVRLEEITPDKIQRE